MKEPWESDSKRRDPRDGLRAESHAGSGEACRKEKRSSAGFDKTWSHGALRPRDADAIQDEPIDDDRLRAEAVRMLKETFGRDIDDADVHVARTASGGWKATAKPVKTRSVKIGPGGGKPSTQRASINIPVFAVLLVAALLLLRALTSS